MTLSPRLGILILLGVGTAFASNHLAARIAFDHGASVAAGVAMRATCTALLLLALMRLQGIRLVLPRKLRVKTLAAGLLITVQSIDRRINPALRASYRPFAPLAAP